MKILNTYKTFLWIRVILIIGAITSCQKDDSVENSGVVTFLNIGPVDKKLDENIWFTGKNLDKVTAIKLPGIETPIKNFLSQTGDKIEIKAPKLTTEGNVVFITANGEIASESMLNFNVTFTVSNIPQEVKAGDNITIKGEYLNWIKEVWFSDQIKVTNFVSTSLTELVVKVPFEAQTGPLKLVGGGTNPMTYTSPNNLTIITKVYRSDFVYTQGLKLYLNGEVWTPHGASLYPTGPNSGYKNSGFRDYMKGMLDLAVIDKFTTIRIVNYMDGNTTDPYDTEVWENIDYLIAEAGSHNLKAILDLSSFRNYLIAKKAMMPYNYADWIELIDFVGKRYKDNATVWLYSLAGEADGPRAGANEHIPFRPTTQELTTFYKEASNALNAIAPDQLISCGGLLYYDYDSGIDWESIFALPNIHVPAIHVYGGEATRAAVPTISAWCKDQNKPFFLEEFGKEKTASDNDIAAYFQDIYTLTKSNGLVGACFWNYGPQTNSDSFDINKESTPKTITTIKINSPLR